MKEQEGRERRRVEESDGTGRDFSVGSKRGRSVDRTPRLTVCRGETNRDPPPVPGLGPQAPLVSDTGPVRDVDILRWLPPSRTLLSVSLSRRPTIFAH